jgi:uncharacterized protein (TIGR02145 family)
MKTFTLTCAMLLLSSIGLFAQSGMTINSGGQVTVNGNTIITPVFVPGQPFVDTRDGQSYPTVVIGTQCWMAKNLNIGILRDGMYDPGNDGIIDKYCYNADENMCNIYGGLYPWDEAMQYGVQDICPTGWHLPSATEYTTLTTFLGGNAVAGGKMKETGTYEDGTGHWFAPNNGATNSSGFTALPHGDILPTNGMASQGFIGSQAYFWSSSVYISVINLYYPYYFLLNNYSEAVVSNYYAPELACSVRCIHN